MIVIRAGSGQIWRKTHESDDIHKICSPDGIPLKEVEKHSLTQSIGRKFGGLCLNVHADSDLSDTLTHTKVSNGDILVQVFVCWSVAGGVIGL